MKWLRWLCVILAVAVTGPTAVSAQDYPTKPVTLVVPKGANVTEIAGQLARTRVLAMPWLFRLAVRLQGADTGLRAGEYRVHLESADGTKTKDATVIIQAGQRFVIDKW